MRGVRRALARKLRFALGGGLLVMRVWLLCVAVVPRKWVITLDVGFNKIWWTESYNIRGSAVFSRSPDFFSRGEKLSAITLHIESWGVISRGFCPPA